MPRVMSEEGFLANCDGRFNVNVTLAEFLWACVSRPFAFRSVECAADRKSARCASTLYPLIFACPGGPRRRGEEDKRKDGRTRADRRGEIDVYQTRIRIGEKAFRSWGPVAYNRTCNKVQTRPIPDDMEDGHQRKRKDPQQKQRPAYHTYLEKKFMGRSATRDHVAKKVAWVDGNVVSDIKGKNYAGAGVFYGDGSPQNRSIQVNVLALPGAAAPPRRARTAPTAPPRAVRLRRDRSDVHLL
eukprot:gene19324-biopygen25527